MRPTLRSTGPATPGTGRTRTTTNVTVVKAAESALPPEVQKALHPNRLTLDEVCDIFTGTGNTAPSDIRIDSTRHIPELSELQVRKATDIAGEAQLQVVRVCPIAGTEDSDEVIVATATTVEGTAAWPEFQRLYAAASRAERAGILGNKQWVEVQRRIITDGINTVNAGHASGGTSTTSSITYRSKIQLKAVEGRTDVLMGTSAKGKVRLTWQGHSGFALARYLGKHGWTGSEAVHTFEAIGLPMGKSAIIGGVYAGKAGTRGDPAPVTSTQHTVLTNILAAHRAKNQKVTAIPTPLPTPTAPPAATSAPTQPKLKAGSKAAKEAALAAHMTAKHEERVANKRKAVWKGQATKAANKAKAG